MPKRKTPATGYSDLSCSEVLLEHGTRRERLATCLRLGYGVAAICSKVVAPLDATHKCHFEPMDPLSLRNAHSKAKTALNAVLQLGRTFGQLEQLSRLTVVAEDGPQAQLACTFEAVTSTYDILAIQPQSEKTLALACTSLPVDIISLDLTKRLAYRFKPSTIAAAMARGVYFEVCYSALLRDSTTRMQFISNVAALVRETRGRGILLSSGARTVLDLRRPVDVVNLGGLLGLTQQQAQHAVTRAPQEVLRHARARKAHRGVLSVTKANPNDIAELTPDISVVHPFGAAAGTTNPRAVKRTFSQLHGVAT
ncbi:RPP30 [Auxenochlorella protothecoides x Auxenochlorella symbiontica]